MYTYIDSLEDLDLLNSELLERSFVGVDTEFRRTSKDNMRLGLLQVNDGEEIYLIDTVAITEPGESCNFLFSDSVTKILHSCKEDVEAIYSWTSRAIVNLFDTQLAEAFLNGEYSIGYQGLVENRVGILIDKGETRSNWIRRPLTDSQLNYAASDVEFLIHLYTNQYRELSETKKLSWKKEELDFLISNILSNSHLKNEVTIEITKKEEKNLLNKFDEIIKNISEIEEVNSTLLFSKRNQKNFLRLTIDKGFLEACNSLTSWRRELISEPLEALFK